MSDITKTFLTLLLTIFMIPLAILAAVCGVLGSPGLIAGFFMLGVLVTILWIRRLIRAWKQKQRITQEGYSPLAAKLTPNLLGSYSPYVIEAAEQLGEARDVTAVPVLITALERCMENQPPGWSERASALANALARIGDRRALPLLYRLDNVRGIGLIPAVRNAIAAIEPQSSLLRPGSIHDVPSHALLRSVQHRPDAKEAATLLRSADRNKTD